jgi:hypothetical protein
MRKILIALVALAWAAPAVAQVSATLPVTCAPGGTCVRATPVTNPDGSAIGAGGTSGPLPAGTNTIGGVVPRGSATLATGQVSVGTTFTQVVAARANRATVTMSVGAANACAFGNTGVTATTGFPLQPVAGATLSLDTSAAIFAVCSATTTVSFVEQF